MYNVAKRNLLVALMSIRDNGAVVRNEGICVNVKALLTETNCVYPKHPLDYLHQLMVEWPKKFSWIFPVGGVSEYDEDNFNNTMWTNSKRIELLNWLIMRLENE